MNRGVESHPCDLLDEVISALNSIPGVTMPRGDGVSYSVSSLRSLYDFQLKQLPVSVGDHVRVNKAGAYGDGTLSVEGRDGIVRQIVWNGHLESWLAMVEMSAIQKAYNGEFEETKVSLFSFEPRHLARIDSHLARQE